MLDFQGLAQSLLGRSRSLLPEWQPGGRLVGREWTCASIRGGQGDSCKVNVETGKWADFAAGTQGGDLISLYAAIHNHTQGDAFKALSDLAPSSSGQGQHLPAPAKIPPPQKPPKGTPEPSWGSNHVSHWAYVDAQGDLLFYIARYSEPDGGKLFVPWSWDGKGWRRRSWANPRPLYGLDLLAKRPGAPVLVVEGEKAADAARTLAGDYYVVVTWPNGAQAAKHADWSALDGRKLLIWPDADEPGHRAAELIAKRHLEANPQAQVKVIDTDGKVKGWDAADALAEGWTWDALKAWATPRAKLWQTPVSDGAQGPLEAPEVGSEDESDPDDHPDAKAAGFTSWESLGLLTGNRGKPVYNVDTCIRVFERMPALNGGGPFVWFDEFYNRFYTNLGGREREWGDVETLNLLAFFQRELRLEKTTDGQLWQAVQIYAHRNPKNAPVDWMKSIKWDQTPRLQRFCSEYLGVHVSPEAPQAYLEAAGLNFWISLVARAFIPGCKADNMIVLESEQEGRFKSSALEVIGGAWYLDCQTDMDDYERFSEVIQGKLLIELSELDSLRKSGITTVKGQLSRKSDRFRPSYARTSADFPRRCVFAGTTNEHNYLFDGQNRRFWPMQVGRIDLARLRDDREQLFAEAISIFSRVPLGARAEDRAAAGAGWWDMPQAETLAAVGARKMTDEWESMVSEFVNGLAETTVESVGCTALGYTAQKLDVGIQRRIGRMLRGLGWTPTTVREGAIVRRVWTPPAPF